jgi:hypothetical protein
MVHLSKCAFSAIAASPILCACKIDIPYIHVHKLLAVTAMDGVYVCFAGAQKQIAKKSLVLETPQQLNGISY